jgi:hypothetical protein
MVAAMTLDEQLIEIENLIQWLRLSRGSGGDAGRRYEALKCVAADLRSRSTAVVSNVLVQLERRVVAARRSQRPSLGYETQTISSAGAELLAHWPTVRRALEAMMKEEGNG